jgi:hypothetical protein
MTDTKERRFIEPKHVETQVFDWGRIQFLSRASLDRTHVGRRGDGLLSYRPGSVLALTSRLSH